MIGGNTTAALQISTTTKNEIGEGVKSWKTVNEIKGFLDLSSGDSKYTTYNAKLQESTHVFVSDWKQIDDPMGLHMQLEIYLQYRGGQNVSTVSG